MSEQYLPIVEKENKIKSRTQVCKKTQRLKKGKCRIKQYIHKRKINNESFFPDQQKNEHNDKKDIIDIMHRG